MSKNDITGDAMVSKALSAEGRANFDRIFKKGRAAPFEKEIEREVCDYAQSKGMLAYKFNSIGHSAVPDRLFIVPGGGVFFIEFKREGLLPTAPQLREHKRLRRQGCGVFVVDNVMIGKAIVDQYAPA